MFTYLSTLSVGNVGVLALSVCAISYSLLIHTPVRKLPMSSHTHTQGVGRYVFNPVLSVRELKCRLLAASNREAALSGLDRRL